MRKIIFIVLLSFFSWGIAFAETTIKAEVDKKSLTTDADLTYKIVIISSEKEISSPLPPSFVGFNILSQAQSSTVSLVEKEAKSVFVYAFILTPLYAGKFHIGPSAVRAKDKIYSTEAFDIEVRQGEEKPKPLSLPESQEPQYDL